MQARICRVVPLITLAACVSIEEPPGLGSTEHSLTAVLVHSFASPGSSPTDLVLQGTTLYWSRDDTIESVPMLGGSVTTYCNPCGDGSGAVSSTPTRLAVDGSGVVYYIAKNGSQHDVATVPLPGALPVFVGVASSAALGDTPTVVDDVPVPILVDTQFVYYTVTATGNPRVFRMPKSGGSRQLLHDATPGILSGFAQSSTSCCSGRLYVGIGGNVISIAKASPFTATVLNNASSPAPSAIVPASSLLFWIERITGVFKRGSSTTLSTPTTVAGCTTAVTASAMTKDASNLYYTRTDGTITRCASSGGTPTVLYTASSMVDPPRPIVHASGVLYWGQGDAILAGTLP